MGFDRVDCALEASAAGVPLVESPPPLPIAERPQALALPVVAMAGGPSFPAMAALLAAGAAATIYLWLRVFSPDAAILLAPAENAAVAFARSSIAAEIDLTLEPASRPQPETVAFGGGRGAPASPAAGSETVAVSNPGGVTTRTASNPNEPAPSTGGGSGGPVVRPAPPPAPPPEEPPAPPPRQTPAPAPPVPTSPPDDRVPGPTLPTPGIPDYGPSGPDDGTRLGS